MLADSARSGKFTRALNNPDAAWRWPRVGELPQCEDLLDVGSKAMIRPGIDPSELPQHPDRRHPKGKRFAAKEHSQCRRNRDRLHSTLRKPCPRHHFEPRRFGAWRVRSRRRTGATRGRNGKKGAAGRVKSDEQNSIEICIFCNAEVSSSGDSKKPPEPQTAGVLIPGFLIPGFLIPGFLILGDMVWRGA